MGVVTIEVDPDLMLSMVETINAALEVLESASDGTANPPLKTALCAAAGLSILVGSWFGEEGDGDGELLGPIATDDPTTCEHPDQFHLPGNVKMCKSCGECPLP